MALPPLILSRRPRRLDSEWTQARSWFGGMPHLGDRPWPRSSTSRPMVFVAQIDLEAVARCAGPSDLPATGALAFFIGEGPKQSEAGFVHVPGPPVSTATPPLPDAPAAFEPGGEILPAKADPCAPRLFPRWPLDIARLPAGGDESEQQEAVSALFTRRQYFFSAKQAFEMLGQGPRPHWWHTAQLFAQCLRAALRRLPARIEQHRGFVASARAHLDKLRPKPILGQFGRRVAEPSPELKKAEEDLARSEAGLAKLQQLTPEFQRFVAEVSDWAGSADPWRSMPPDTVDRLKTAFGRGRAEFEDCTRYFVPHALDDLETETLLALMTADESAFATMPGAVRALINEKYLLPTGTWHQMFGQGVDIQGNAVWENEGNVLRLQLVYDDMMGWRFGDMGAFQFWIPPGDLAAGNWKAARLTFECH